MIANSPKKIHGMQTSMTPCEKLFEPMRIGSLHLKNRIIMPAMTTNYANRDGSISPRLINYYRKRAEGGAAMIIVESACVDYPRGKGLINQIDISRDQALEGLGNLAYAITKAGAKAAIQLHHAGWLRSLAEPIPIAPIAPSALRYRGFDTPEEASLEQIEELVHLYVNAALRAQKAGFEAVEYHGAHGYGISQFLSPRNNRRMDEYGGTPERRIRFFKEIITLTRDLLGPDFPIICRIDADEFADDGITIKESCGIVARLEEYGASAIDVSVSTTPDVSSREIVSNVPPMGCPGGTWVHLTEKIKACLKIPVIAVGKIHDPNLAEQILAEEKADFIAVGRQLIADPRWPVKVKEGRFSEIRPCIACNTCIRQVTRKKSEAVCAVNPEAGREAIFERKPKKIKRTLILGSGPAGIQAALSAAQQGHNVEIWESSGTAGGQVNLSAMLPGQDILFRLIDYMKQAMERENVPIRFSMQWNADDIRAYQPDTIIVATGSKEVLPEIPGIRSSFVKTIRTFLTHEDGLGKRILIVGGCMAGCEVADYLCGKGKTITLIEQAGALAEGMDPVRRRLLLGRLRKAGVDIKNHTGLQAITPSQVLLRGSLDKAETLEVDTVIIAAQTKADRETFNSVEGLASEVFVIGDALRPRGMLDAVTEGWMVGHRI